MRKSSFINFAFVVILAQSRRATATAARATIVILRAINGDARFVWCRSGSMDPGLTGSDMFCAGVHRTGACDGVADSSQTDETGSTVFQTICGGVIICGRYWRSGLTGVFLLFLP